MTLHAHGAPETWSAAALHDLPLTRRLPAPATFRYTICALLRIARPDAGPVYLPLLAQIGSSDMKMVGRIWRWSSNLGRIWVHYIPVVQALGRSWLEQTAARWR